MFFLPWRGLCLAYAAFRQLSGPRTALLASSSGLLCVEFCFARKIYLQSQTIFFSMLALTVLLYSLRREKLAFRRLAWIFLGLGAVIPTISL